MSDKAQLIYDGKTYDIPVITGTENEKGLDISKLRDQSGLITYDVGFKNTGSTKSAITFLDGELGILRHRGYSIEELAANADFLEVAYLVIWGELPNKEQYTNFKAAITHHSLVHEGVKNVFDAFPTGSHPMGQLMTLMGMMSSYYPSSLDPHAPKEAVDTTIIRLLAKVPTLCGWIYKKSKGHPLLYPNNKLGYVPDILRMTFGHVTEEYVPDPVICDAMNKLLILHADHEQNCSASTVRIVGSANTNMYASVSAGIAALWGPLHGGANQDVLEMLDLIQQDGGDVNKWVAKAKDKNSNFRLAGFGHRVYKNFDPRAKIIKKACDDVLNKLGINDPILDLAKRLEEVALKDEYFVSRKLYPNVDFYSGIIYRAMGFPTNMFTVLFALGRLPGWIAQWKEMRDGGEPIGRPRQVYVGATERPFVHMIDRK